MNPAVKFCLWIYRRLARAFPHEFQMIYGTDVIQLGEDSVEEIWKRHGFGGLLRLLGDLAVRVPVEYASEIRRDVAYAFRTLSQSPGFAGVGIISLGLGIGVTTAVFSEVNAMMFRDMPAAHEPSQLVMARGISYPNFEQYRDQHSLFTGAAAVMQVVPFGVSLDPGAKAERIFGQIVSPDYFSVFGVGPAMGRVLDPAVDKPGEPAMVVVSERFWRDHLHSDPAAVGRVIRLNGHSTTIAGVAAKDFLGVMPVIPADLFLPSTAPAQTAPELAGDVIHNSGSKAFNVVFRLAPGVTMDSAEAALDTLARHLDESTLDPERNRKGRRVHLIPAGTVLPLDKQVRPVIIGIYAMLMGLLLTIACMNLANMLLARGAARRKEIAIRLAVGASRFRLVRQMVIESLVLALSGGAAGFLFGDWLAHLMSQDEAAQFHALALRYSSGYDGPAVHDCAFGRGRARIRTGSGLRGDQGRRGADAQGRRQTELRPYRRFGLRNLLVVFQVAGSLALLLVCGFVVLGYNKGSQADVSFDPATMYLFSIDPIRDGYTPEQAAAFFDKLPERMRNVGAVQSVALALAPPFSSDAGMSNFYAGPSEAPDLSMDAKKKDKARTMRAAVRLPVGAGYFTALSVRPVSGREFSEQDQRLPSSGVVPVILSQSAANEHVSSSGPHRTPRGPGCEVLRRDRRGARPARRDLRRGGYVGAVPAVEPRQSARIPRREA